MICKNIVPKLLFVLFATSVSITSHCMLKNAMTTIKQNPGQTLLIIGTVAQMAALQHEDHKKQKKAIVSAVAEKYDCPNVPPAVIHYVHNLMRQCGCPEPMIKNTFIKEEINKGVGFNAWSDGERPAYNFIYIPTKKIPLVEKLADPHYITTKRKELAIPPTLRHEIGHLYNHDFEIRNTVNDAISCSFPTLQGAVSLHLLRNAKSPWSFAAATALLIPGWWLTKKSKNVSGYILSRYGEANADKFAIKNTENPNECAAIAQYYENKTVKFLTKNKDTILSQVEKLYGGREKISQEKINTYIEGQLSLNFLLYDPHLPNHVRSHFWKQAENKLRAKPQEQPTKA